MSANQIPASITEFVSIWKCVQIFQYFSKLIDHIGMDFKGVLHFLKETDEGYRCCCGKGFSGTNCENEGMYNACDDVTCDNGGACFGDNTTFNCTCLPGFEGVFCESNADDCVDYPCENGGFCVDGNETATCNCPWKFTGDHCEIALDPEFGLKFETPSTNNYVELSNTRRLREITVAFFMKTSYRKAGSSPTPVSYSYSYSGHLIDNALTFLNTNSFILYIQGTPIYTGFTANRDSKWHHYAMTWENTKGSWTFFVDGQICDSGENLEAGSYIYPGTFILGQDQDDVGSAFTLQEAFAGDITQVYLDKYFYTKTNGQPPLPSSDFCLMFLLGKERKKKSVVSSMLNTSLSSYPAKYSGRRLVF